MSGVAVSGALRPFRGLAPFGDSDVDAMLFFGRERDVEVIAANVMASRLTILYGPSGVGKTSVLHAGVARRLRGDPHALVVILSNWAHDPARDLAAAVEQAAENRGGRGDPVARSSSLAQTLSVWTRRLGADAYLLLDQFEELFLYAARNGGSRAFPAAIADALEHAPRANFLISVRDDALSELDALSGQIPSLFGSRLRLERLDRSAGRAAIIGPIERYNELVDRGDRVEIEPDLVETVLDEVSAGRLDLGRSGRGGVEHSREDRVETPYLQLVLDRLWSTEAGKGSRRLRLETLDELGGARRIVEEHVERALAELSPDEQRAAAAMFNQLVTPSGAKIAHRPADLARYAAVEQPTVEKILQRLSNERIVRGEDDAGTPRYEIFHDALAEPVLAWRERHTADARVEAERAAAARRQRRLLIVAAVAVVLVAVLSALVAYALVQRSNTRDEARRARARELAARSGAELSSDPERSVALALRAAEIEPSARAEETLRAALRGLRVRAVLQAGRPVAKLALNPEGTLIASAGGDGAARIVRARDGRHVRTLEHGGRLTDVAFSGDGRLVATAGDDATARVWDVSTGRQLQTLHHSGAVTGAFFSPRGHIVATTSRDGSLRLWDIGTGRLLHRLRHRRAVVGASFSADGTLIATAAGDTIARVFDVSSGRRVARLVQRGGVTAVAFAPRRPLLATAGADKVARLWDVPQRRLKFSLRGHFGRILDVAFSPSGDRLATSSADQTARVWSTSTGELVSILLTETNQVLRARFSPDGQSVVTASADRAARVFDATGALRTTLVGHRDSVTDAVFTRGGSVATASADGTVRLWDRRQAPTLKRLALHRGPIVSVAFAARDDRVESVDRNGTVRLWRARMLEPAAKMTVPAPVGAAEFSGNGRRLLIAADRTAIVFSAAGVEHVATLVHPSRITRATISMDGRTVATATRDGAVRLWRVGSGRLMRELPAKGAVTALAFSFGGERLAVAGADGVVRIWRVASGRRLHALRGHRGSVVSVAFTRGGRRLLTAGADGTARVWSSGTGAAQLVLRGHRAALTSARFSPDAHAVLTASLDGDARLWDARTGRRRALLRVHYAGVRDAAFSGDGRWIVTVGGGGAGVFNVGTGRLLFLVRTRDLLLTHAAFSGHGRRIVVGGSEGNVETYDCRLCGKLPQLERIARARLAALRRRR